MSDKMREALERIAAYDVPDAHEMIQIARRALAEQPAQGAGIAREVSELGASLRAQMRRDSGRVEQPSQGETAGWHKNAADAAIVAMSDFAGFDDWWGSIDEKCSDEIMDSIACAISDQAPAVPEGWKLVPIEPTQNMSLAGRKALAEVADRMESAKLVSVSLIDFWQRVGHRPADYIYEAMLAAAEVKP